LRERRRDINVDEPGADADPGHAEREECSKQVIAVGWERTDDVRGLAREVCGLRGAADSGIVGRATEAGMDDDGTAEEFPGLFEEIDQARIDVDLFTGTTTLEFWGWKVFREVAHASKREGKLERIKW
jgi:hypothetical protein